MIVKRLIAVNTMHTGSKRCDHRGYAVTKSAEQVDGLLAEDWLREMVAEIRAGNEKLKDKLPYICPHYWAFRNNHRAQADILPECFTFMTCVDVDDITLVEDAISRARVVNADEYSEWHDQVLRIEYSARKKVHFYIRIPKGMTIEEAQKAFCQEIDVPYDESCITPERFIYLTGIDEEVYRSPHWLEPLGEDELAERREAYLQRGLDIDGRRVEADPKALPLKLGGVPPKEGREYVDAGENILPRRCATPPLPEGGSPLAHPDGNHQYPTDYHGIPFTDIIRKYWEMFNDGKEPHEGDRDTLTFQLASDLRHICGRNPDWLDEVIPCYDGFPLEEKRRKIQSALALKNEGMPYRLKQVLQALKEQAGIRACGGTITTPPPMPKRLPPLIRLLTKNVPDFYKPAVAAAVFPGLGAHLHGVKFRYWDNVDHEATFMNVLVGRQSIGKGSIKKPIEYIMDDIRQRDQPNRQREAEWKQKNPGAKPKKDMRPTDICIQMLIDNLTDAVFNQRIVDANNNGERFIYTIVDEIEGLKKVTSRGSADEVGLLIRKAFDNSMAGQERVGADSVSGIAPLRWNFNASTTPPNARRFFGKMVNDGTVSRLDLSTIISTEDDDGNPPILGIYDHQFAAELKPYIERLDAASGLIECSQSTRLALQIRQENKDAAKLYDSEAYRVFSYRSNVIAWLKGMVLYVAHGYKWSKEIADFVRWSEQYDLWCKMLYFGKQLERELHEEMEIQRQSGPQNQLELLPDQFTREQYLLMRQSQGKSGDGASTLRTWTSRKYIYFDQTLYCYCKTQEYKQKYGGKP